MALYFIEGISQKPGIEKNIQKDSRGGIKKPAMNSKIRLEVVINSI